MIPGRVLIVDDEIYITKIVAELLEGQVEKVFTATDGQMALEILRTEKIHCVLTDIAMPIMDGISFVKEARRLGYKTPFVFYTGHGSEKMMAIALKYNAFDFIDKPDLTNLEPIVLSGVKTGLGELLLETEEEFITRYKSFCERKGPHGALEQEAKKFR